MCAPEEEEDGGGEGVRRTAKGMRRMGDGREGGQRSPPPVRSAGGGRCRGEDSGWERLRRATPFARPGVEVHDGNIGDRRDGRRLLRVVQNHPRRRRVPVSGVLTCAEHARGDELGEEGRGREWGEQDTRRHKPTGAAQELALVCNLIRLADGRRFSSWTSCRRGKLLLLLLAGDFSRGRQRGRRYEGRGTQLLSSVDFITQ